MTEKDKYLFTQVGLTFLLLIAAVFLIKPAIFGQYQLFLIGGLSAGFVFSWYNRKGSWAGLKYLTDAFILITLAWIGWRIFKSTFLYKEVIAIFIQGIIILEVIFSFNTPGKIAHLRLLSVLIFLTSPVFAAVYSLPLAIGYLLLWLAILRSAFAGFLQPLKEKGWSRYYSLLASLVCFFVVLFLAWFLSANVYLGQIKKGMFFVDEDLQDINSGGGRESDQADKFYSLQEDLLSKITGLALEEGSYENRRQLVYLLSELVKETIKTIELDKAEVGLIDILKRQGEGLKGAGQAMTLAREYLSKKNSRNLGRNKEEFMDKLQKQSLDIFNKIKITSLVNKLAQANSDQQRQDSSQALQAAIQNAPLNQDIRKELSELAHSISNLKAFELYRSKIRDLEQKAGALAPDEESGKKIAEVISDIKHTQSLEDFKQSAEKIRQLKDDSEILEGKSAKEMLKSLEEAWGMKLDLFSAEQLERVKEAASQKQDLGSSAIEFDQKMEGASSAMNHQEFIKEFSGLSQQNKDNALGLTEELRELLDLKTESFKQDKKDKIDNLMGKEFSPAIKKEILEALKQMEESESPEDLKSQEEELASKIRELERRGSISSESAAGLLKAIAEFQELLQARLQAEAELKNEEVPEKNSRKSDYLDQLQQAIQDSSLSSNQKQQLKALAVQLQKVQSLSQLEEVKEALENEISLLERSEVDLEKKSLAQAAKLKEINKISEKINQAAQIKRQFLASEALADILEKIERLSQKDVAAAQVLEEKLEQLRKSTDSEETEKIIEDLKEILSSEKKQINQDALQVADGESERIGRGGQLKIFILHPALIISQGTTVPLKVISVDMNGHIVKELTSDVEWFSTQPQVAWVDDLNFLHPVAKGSTRIKVVYKGSASQYAEINVIEDLDAQTVRAVKQELVQ